MKKTYPSLIALHLKSFLEQADFTLDRGSELGGFHTTAHGTRLQMIDPTGQKYEILIQPIFPERAAV